MEVDDDDDDDVCLCSSIRIERVSDTLFPSFDEFERDGILYGVEGARDELK